MFQDLLKFSAYLLVAASISYGIHYWILSFQDAGQALEIANFSYKFNVGFTLLFTSSLIMVQERLKEQLGLIYLVSGAVKLGVLIFLAKSSSFEINKNVFLHFFVPYVVCVVVEIIFIIKILNRTNFAQDK